MRIITVLLLLSIIFFSCEDGSDDPAYPGSPNALSYYADEVGGISANPDPVAGERYNEYVENPFVKVAESPVSTFSVDADGGSYANVRRFLTNQMTPPPAAIRAEEFINYFPLDYADPTGNTPIAINGEVSTCPWNNENQLIRIGIKGKSVEQADFPVGNLVLLVDVSGSMGSPDKLPLLQESLKLFVEEMRPEDKIALVTYAGSAGVVLDATAGTEKAKILQAITSLSSGGSTAGAQGIITAYEIAERNFLEDGNNRVIIASDGDFNVGPSSQEELIELIESKRDKGIFLTVLGMGTGNFNDAAMEQIANHGNGTYEYIDQLEQAKKVFIYEYGKFLTVAKDVKVQVSFNEETVESYRLIGYENRLLEEEDFTDDTKDAAEIGAGQTITALYEIVPSQNNSPALRQEPIFTIDFRYKNANENESAPLQLAIFDEGNTFSQASENLRFAASAVGFAMLLRDSEYKGTLDYPQLLEWSRQATRFDPHGFRQEFITLVQQASTLR
ncbi:vWA domain-containing protein [Tunicatimonas pelagia]|uniref:vWA domain-containing protein n=1 Tax=Tunicatimonas pelagia TaxID=931531 RepID=UPI0026669C55|nr:VWA domain-containing protein [Tunicatimonas pelagia]WKN42540.1 VWA domain-containing protein [Tunicatimonas pelagia]